MKANNLEFNGYLNNKLHRILIFKQPANKSGRHKEKSNDCCGVIVDKTNNEKTEK